MLGSIALMNGITEKMAYLQTRQRILAQNLSNADTPDYVAMDVKAPDFRKSMARFTGHLPMVEGQKISMDKTSGGHVAHRQRIDRAEEGNPVRRTYEMEPVKNSITLEEQMMNASQNAVDYQLVTNIYNKQVDMLRAAMRSS